jgi:hypothetical protein
VLPAVVGQQAEPRGAPRVALRAQDALACEHGKPEGLGVAAQVAHDLVAGRVAVGGAREWHARQRRVACGRKEREAVVVAWPRASGLPSRLQDLEGEARPFEVVASGQAGLAASDDERVEDAGTLPRLPAPRGHHASSAAIALALSGQAETNSTEPRTSSGTSARPIGRKPKCGKKPSAVSVSR